MKMYDGRGPGLHHPHMVILASNNYNDIYGNKYVDLLVPSARRLLEYYPADRGAVVH